MSKFKYNLALALGGGGARGLAHIGVLRELLKENIEPDLIVGTSMGAVVGGMYAQNPDIDIVEKKISDFVKSFGSEGHWLNFLRELHAGKKEDLLHDITNYIKKHYMKIKAMTSISLEEMKLLYDPLNEFLMDDRIENCRIPFAAVAVDLRNGKQVVLNSGPIIKAVYASAAVQGVFPPLEYRDMFLADGGPVAVVPVQAARNLGARYVIAVDVSMKLQRETSFSSGLQIILRSDNISQERLKHIDLQAADFVISPSVRAVHWSNFGRMKYCVKRGEIAAKNALEKYNIKKSLLPWWRKVI